MPKVGEEVVDSGVVVGLGEKGEGGSPSKARWEGVSGMSFRLSLDER